MVPGFSLPVADVFADPLDEERIPALFRQACSGLIPARRQQGEPLPLAVGDPDGGERFQGQADPALGHGRGEIRRCGQLRGGQAALAGQPLQTEMDITPGANLWVRRQDAASQRLDSGSIPSGDHRRRLAGRPREMLVRGGRVKAVGGEDGGDRFPERPFIPARERGQVGYQLLDQRLGVAQRGAGQGPRLPLALQGMAQPGEPPLGGTQAPSQGPRMGQGRRWFVRLQGGRVRWGVTARHWEDDRLPSEALEDDRQM